jgi:hypothetical protein
MSNLSAIGLILSTAIIAYVGIIYTSNALGKHIDSVVIGVAEGVAMSMKHRYMKLFLMYVSQMGAVVGIAMILAFGFMRIADSATDSGVRTLAYLVAGLAAFTAVQWLVLGIAYLIYGLQVLRQAQAD